MSRAGFDYGRGERFRTRNPETPLDRRVREYLSTAQLAEVTPWSVEAIEKMMKRGTLKRDVHYFQPFGRRTQLVFKWTAIVGLIEGHSDDAGGQPVVTEKGKVFDVEKAMEGLGRLLDR